MVVISFVDRFSILFQFTLTGWITFGTCLCGTTCLYPRLKSESEIQTIAGLPFVIVLGTLLAMENGTKDYLAFLSPEFLW